MPILGSSAYVSFETVTNLIRALANDMIYSQAGEILTDNANFMAPLLNDALEWFQNEVNNHGVDTFTKETWLTGIGPITVNDPGVQVNISDTGYFDGTNNNPLPQVPNDLLEPILLWERQTGSTEDWIPMQQIPDGLPSVQQSSRFGIWEWREDGIYMLGATQENDIRLRYKGTIAQFVTPQDTLYFRGACGPIAFKMVSNFLISKNPEQAQIAAQEADKRLSQIATRNARTKQREAVTRISYGSPRGRSRFTPPRNS